MSTLPSPSLERRVRHYWIEDGLAEMVVGAGFLPLAVLLALSGQPHTDQAPFWRWVRAIYIVAFVVGTRWLVQRLKWRITYPRTGYLAYSRPRWERRLLRIVFVAAAFAGIAFLGLTLLADRSRAYPLVLSLLMAGLYLGMAWSQAWPRGVGYALVALLSGWAALVWWDHPVWSDLVRHGALHFAALGVAQIVGGAWALWRYLNRHPKPIEEGTR